MTLKQLYFILVASFCSTLSGCYDFESDPLIDSDKVFKETRLYAELRKRFGNNYSEVKDLIGEDSPNQINTDAADRAIEISDTSVITSSEYEGEWSLVMTFLGEDHLFVCKMALFSEERAIKPKNGLDIEIDVSSLINSAKISGDQKLLKDYAMELANKSTKICIGTPLNIR